MTTFRTLCQVLILFAATAIAVRAQTPASADPCQVELVNLDGSPLPAKIEFIPDYQCSGPQTRQFLLRNTGPADELATVRFQQRQAFTLAPTTAQQLPTGGPGVTITISFDPGVAGDYVDTLMINSRNCVNIPVVMTGHRSALSYSVSSLKFNGVSVGFPVTMSSALVNTSAEAKITVKDAFIRPAGGPFTIANKPLPKTLNPGESASVDVTYAPVAGRGDTVELVFVLDEPCPREVPVRVTGFGIRSSVRLNADTLDYGTKYLCEEEVKELEVQNMGSASLQVVDLPIRGNDPGAFQQVTPLTFPVTIEPGRSLKVPYRFMPTRSNHDGLNTAQVSVITSDSAKPSVPVTLMGVVSRQFLDAPVKFDLGRVAVGLFSAQDMVLTNTGSRTLRVDSVATEAPFTCTGVTLPADVPPSGTITFRIRFTPADSNRARAPMTIYYGTPCRDSVTVALIGNGKLVPVGAATMMLPDVSGVPGDRITLPLLLDKSTLLRESESTTFRGLLRFNRRMLMLLGVRARYDDDPAAARSGTAKFSTSTQGNDRVVTFQIRNAPVPTAPDTLAYFDLLVLAGDSSATRLHLDTLYWTDGDVVVDRRDGRFLLTTCSDRRVFGDGDFGVKFAAPNPFNPSTTISFETVEDGETSLTVVDLEERIVARLLDRERLPVGEHQLVWDATGIPSGTYHVILASPARRSIYRLVLVK